MGAVRADFKTLCTVWAHSGLSRARKLEIYNACIVSKLTYCLEILWLNKAELNKLDAFQAYCLRKIAGIRHSYVSRVSNKTVRETLECKPLSHRLLEQQLLFIGRIASSKQDSILRKTVFIENSFTLVPVKGPRRKGRPRKHWTKELYGISVKVAGSKPSLANMWAEGHASQEIWRRAVKAYCSSLTCD